MKLHLSLNVADLSASVRFYQAFFGVPAHKLRPDYANFDLDAPPLKLALNAHPEPGGAGRLNHLGILLENPEQVRAMRERLVAAGLATFDERDAACCYAKQDKIWVHDPDGNAWEVYALLEDLAEDPERDHAGQLRAEEASCCSPAQFTPPGSCCPE